MAGLIKVLVYVLLPVVVKALPNFIFILADDMGYGDNSLDEYSISELPFKALTPNLERMAREGKTFTNAYADSSVCGPSRYSLLTGRHTGFTLAKGNAGDSTDYVIRPEDQTIAQVLTERGYDCAIIGKWGFETHPLDVGFSKFYGQKGHIEAHNMFPTRLYSNTVENGLRGANLELSKNKGAKESKCSGSADKCSFVNDLFTEEAVRYIEEHPDDSTPFFLFLSYTTPHVGSWGSGSSIRAIAPTAWCPRWLKVPSGTSKSDICRYRSSIENYLDRDVGRIINLTESMEIATNTLIIFTSDNGPPETLPLYKRKRTVDSDLYKSTGGLRGGKRTLYEGGLRVPFIALWQGKTKAGTVSDFQLQLSDLFYTWAQIAGATKKIWTPKELSSRSISNLLYNKGLSAKSYLYFEYCPLQVANYQAILSTPSDKCSWAVISGKSKLMWHHDKQEFELYNLEENRTEQINEWSENPSSTIYKLKSKLEGYHNSAHRPIQDLGFYGSSKYYVTKEDLEASESCSCEESEGFLINEETGICAMTAKNEAQECLFASTYQEANALCLSQGARLCTFEEAQQLVPPGAGCNLDPEMSWTSTKCGKAHEPSYSLTNRRTGRKGKTSCKSQLRAGVKCCKNLC